MMRLLVEAAAKHPPHRHNQVRPDEGASRCSRALRFGSRNDAFPLEIEIEVVGTVDGSVEMGYIMNARQPVRA